MLIWGETMRSKTKAKDVEQGAAWGNAAAVPALDRITVTAEEARRSTFLRFCSALNFLTSLAMFSVICCNAYFSLFPCNHFIGGRLGLLLSAAAMADLPTGVVRLFSCIFATLVICAEQETGFVSRNFSFLDSWVFRGLFIVFIGSLQLLAKIPCELMLHYRLNQGAGTAAVSLGLVYLGLGFLCFRQLRSRTIDQIRRKKQTELTAKSLVEQRNEIEQLLAETQKRLQS